MSEQTKRAWTLILVSLLAGGAALWGETNLTIDEAVSTALRDNATAKRSEIALNALDRKASNAFNVLTPSIDGSVGVTRASGTDANTWSGSITASIALSPAVFSSIETAKLAYEAGKIDRETSLREVELSVRTAFYGLLYEKAYVAQLEKTLETTRLQYEQTAAKQKAGLVPEVDLLSAQVALESLKPSLEAARISLTNDTESFKRVLGIDQSETIVLIGSLEEAQEIGDIRASALTGSSAAVLALETSLEMAKTAKAGTFAGTYLPTLSLSYSLKRTAAELNSAEWIDAGYVTLAASVALDNFLPFSSAAETLRDSKDAVEDLEIALADARISERLQKESLLRSINQSRSALQAKKLSLRLAERNYELTNQAYRSGTKDILSLQNSADSLREAQVAVLKESYTLLSAVLNLEQTTGVPFGTLGR